MFIIFGINRNLFWGKGVILTDLKENWGCSHAMFDNQYLPDI